MSVRKPVPVSPMTFKPPNPNPLLPNLFTMYLACSGGGKSQAMAQNPAIPKAGARVILWDQSYDHPGLHYTSKKGFVTALRKGIESGKGFRVAYAGPASVEDFEWFVGVVWRVLDGKHLTYLLVEELAEISPSAGKASKNAAILMNQGRKFGLVFHGTTQFPQECAKTYYRNCLTKYVGVQADDDTRQKLGKLIGLKLEDIARLDNLEFFRHEGRKDPATLVKLKYRAPKGVRVCD